MSHNFRSSAKTHRLEDLANCVQFCNVCPRMEHRSRVISNLNGNVNTDVLFIAEAPGRLGADKTGIPLYGDKTGNNFEKLLYSIGWNRNDVFITNAVLCNPRDTKGNNDTPSNEEIYNCSIFLSMTINLVRPKVIVTLGRVALEALKHIQNHSYSLIKSVGRTFSWNTYLVFPLYHPAPRAIIHRSSDLQILDFRALASILGNLYSKPVEEPIPLSFNNFPFDFGKEIDCIKILLLYFINKLKDISFFKATKLLYLFDYQYILKFGQSFTGSTYLRQVEGPWLPKMKDITNSMNGDQLSLYFFHGKPFIRSLDINIDFTQIPSDTIQIIEEFLTVYGSISDRGMKIAAYRTPPMQYILEQENKNIKMLNKPVINKNQTILDINHKHNENLLL